MNLQEDYCSFELSKLLKEKGFDEPCNSFYILLDNGDYRYTMSDFPYKNSCKYNVSSFARPTHQIAMKWLREVYGIYISVEKTFLINDIDDKTYLAMVHTKEYHTSYNSWQEYHSTYEGAVEAAIKYVLEKFELSTEEFNPYMED